MNEGGERAANTGLILADGLSIMLRLLHPFTPYVTEALYGYLKQAVEANPMLNGVDGIQTEHLIVAPWPESLAVQDWEVAMVKDFELVQEIVRSIRNLRSENKVEPNKKLEAAFLSQTRSKLLDEQKEVISDLAGLKLEAVSVLETKPEAEGLTALVVDRVEIFLELTSEADDEADRERLTKELQEAESHIKRLEGLLASPFAQKAPEHVVAAERAKLEDYKATAEKLRERLA